MGTVLKILKSRLTPYLGMLVLMVALWLVQMSYLDARQDNLRMSQNEKVIMENVRLNDSTYAAKTSAFKLTEKEFNESRGKDRNGYANTVAYLKSVIKDAKLKPSNLVTGVVSTVVAADTTVADPVDKPQHNTILDTLRYNFFTRNDSSWVTVVGDRAIKISHYRFKPTLLITSEARNRKNGRKHWLFPNSRLIWGKQQFYLLTVDIPHAVIQDLTVIEK